MSFVSFLVLFFGGLFVTRMLMRGLSTVIKWDKLHWSLQGMGLLIGAVRGVWVAGVLLLILLSLGVDYLDTSIERRSLSAPRLASGTERVLGWTADHLPGHQARRELLPSVILPLPALRLPK